MSRSRTVLRSSRAAARIASSATLRTCSDSMSTTPSEQFMPDRSLMYFFSFDTTIRTSLSYVLDSAGPPDVEPSLGVYAGADSTTRRGGFELTCAVEPAAADRYAIGVGAGPLTERIGTAPTP